MIEPPSPNADLTSASAAIGVSSRLLNELEIVADWGLLATDRNLKVTFLNSFLERHAGRPIGELIGQPLFDAFPTLRTRKYDKYYRDALDGRTAVLSQRLHHYLLPLSPPAPSARFQYMQQTCRIIPLVEAGEVCGTLSIIEDVTERVAYESELRERVAALRDADRHKDEFLAMLAHELRNPLAPISNAVQILRLTGMENPMVEGARDIIERQLVQMVRLVDDLLDISRVSCGKIQLQLSSVDLRAVAHQAIETSRPLIDSRDHAFEAFLPDQPVLVNGDFVRLAQSVSNLLNNAAKYTDDGGKLSLVVEADPESGHAAVRVRDNGRGIDPSFRDRLFTLFYQADRNLDRSEGGLGIGLALVKRLMEMHGGTVTAESDGRGLGSEFTLRLPLRSEAASPQKQRESSADSGTPLKVLLVDDNRDAADSMAMLLRADGHQVAVAYDPDQAITLALEDRPAVILLDIGLPGLSGFDVCRILRERGLKETSIIAMSGYAPDQNEGADNRKDFDAHLVKPVPYRQLSELLKRHTTRLPTKPSASST